MTYVVIKICVLVRCVTVSIVEDVKRNVSPFFRRSFQSCESRLSIQEMPSRILPVEHGGCAGFEPLPRNYSAKCIGDDFWKGSPESQGSNPCTGATIFCAGSAIGEQWAEQRHPQGNEERGEGKSPAAVGLFWHFQVAHRVMRR